MIILQTTIGWKSDLFPIFHIRPGEPCGQRNTISKIKTGFRKPDRDQRIGSENVLSLNKNTENQYTIDALAQSTHSDNTCHLILLQFDNLIDILKI